MYKLHTVSGQKGFINFAMQVKIHIKIYLSFAVKLPSVALMLKKSN